MPCKENLKANSKKYYDKKKKEILIKNNQKCSCIICNKIIVKRVLNRHIRNCHSEFAEDCIKQLNDMKKMKKLNMEMKTISSLNKVRANKLWWMEDDFKSPSITTYNSDEGTIVVHHDYIDPYESTLDDSDNEFHNNGKFYKYSDVNT